MSVFRNLGLFEIETGEADKHVPVWSDFMAALIVAKGEKPPTDATTLKEGLMRLLMSKTGSEETAAHVMGAVEFLDLLSTEQKFPKNTSPIDALCELLQDKLAYEEGERDMVLLHHRLEYTKADGVKETQTSTLHAYGTVKTNSNKLVPSKNRTSSNFCYRFIEVCSSEKNPSPVSPNYCSTAIHTACKPIF